MMPQTAGGVRHRGVPYRSLVVVRAMMSEKISTMFSQEQARESTW
jgi:hypothetical protein